MDEILQSYRAEVDDRLRRGVPLEKSLHRFPPHGEWEKVDRAKKLFEEWEDEEDGR